MPGNDLYTYGMLIELTGAMDTNSNSLSWNVYAGDTAEEAYNSTTARLTGTFPPGRGFSNYVMVRGQMVCIQLSDTTPWAFESLTATVRKVGKVRLF